MTENEILKRALAVIYNHVNLCLIERGQQDQDFQWIKQRIVEVMVGDETNGGINLNANQT